MVFPVMVAAALQAGAATGGLQVEERQELIPLPAGSITARGWMRTMLERSREGMGGHYGEFDPDQFEKPGLTKDYDARLPGATWVKDHEMPGWCAEMSGEYRLGQYELAETLDDAGLRERARVWREALLAGQEADGYLGAYRPQDNRQEDFNPFGAHYYYRTLLLEYGRTGDRRILDAVHRGLLWFCTAWADSKKTTYASAAIIWPMVEVYRLTGDKRLLEFCESYRRFLNKRAKWEPFGRFTPRNAGGFERLSVEEGAYHVVAYAHRAQLSGILALANGDRQLLGRSVAALDRHVANVGWQATYAPVSDFEHTSFPSCIGETEYCNFVCWMEYLQWLSRLTGEARFGDMIERIVFNAAMGARKKDERAIAYNSSPNQFRATKRSANGGCQKYYEVYCPCEFAACCSAQSLRLMPSYLLKSVMLTRGGDLAVNAYGPCHVVAEGLAVDMETAYPFEETVRLRVAARNGAWAHRLRLRRPSWATGLTVVRNGREIAAADRKGWIELDGPWTKDEVEVRFSWRPVVRAARERNMREPSRVIEWGPLVFAQPLKEKWTPVAQEPTSRPLPPGWPWFEVTCAEKPPLYAIPVSSAFDPKAIRVEKVVADGYPWERPPVRLKVPLVRAADAYGKDPELQVRNPGLRMNPVTIPAGARAEEVELVPFGATNLRITCFPLGVD